MTYILAGNGSEAQDWATKQGLAQRTFCILHAGMKGIRKKDTDKLALVGTWKDRPDLMVLRAVLAPLGIEVPSE